MSKLKRNIWVILLLVIILGAIFYYFSVYNKDNYETIDVVVSSIIKTVEISGKVVPGEEVNLSFSAPGAVTVIYKDVGDAVSVGTVLAKIDSSEISGEISEAVANLESIESRLNEISGGFNSSEIAFKKNSLIETLNKSFVSADGIIRNQVDTFFESPLSRFPNFDISLGNYFVRKNLGETRYNLESLLKKWKTEADSLTISNVNYQNAYNTVTYLNEVEKLLSIIAKSAYDFSPSGDTTQSQIDAYLSMVSSGRNTISSLVLEVNTSLDALRSIEAEVPVQNAKISSSEATVARLQSKISKYVLISPFEGIVTENNLKVGKYMSTSDIAFTLISNSPLEIETYIPEVNIVGVDVGDTAILKFDALGEDVRIDAVITHVDPKETIKDGVVTYRTKINLKTPNVDLRPGMSTDIEIIKETTENQIIIPSYVIQKDGDKEYVEILIGENVERRDVVVMDKDGRGSVSISSGLNVRDKIVIPK